MHLIALCPTYGRPSLVRNALALFLAQRLADGDTAHLLILDDAGQIATQRGDSGRLTWQVECRREWIPLTRKYAPMLELARRDMDARLATSDQIAWICWDDDDVYLPWHLAAHAAALRYRPWSHPSRAWSTFGIDPLTQSPTPKTLSGRHYHGALAVRGDLMAELNGWAVTDRSDYDKQMLARCRDVAGPPADPCEHYPPSYIYRWQDTGRDHCSGRSRGGRYQPPRIQEPGRVPTLTPAYDASTQALLARLASLESTL